MLRLMPLIFALLATAALAKSEPDWLAYGELRGHIAPCGCDPLTDLGGIRRVARLVATERENSPDLAVFDLGNNFPHDGNKAKISTLAAATVAIRPLATLFNYIDARLWPTLRTRRGKEPLPPYVLSHLKKVEPGIARLIADRRFVVFGFTEGVSGAVPWSERLRSRWHQDLKGHPGKRRVLLFAGSEKTLAHIKDTGLFHEVIVASSAAVNAEPTQIEKAEPGRLLTPAGYYRVPSFGQGILRGGGLRQKKSLKTLLQKCPAGDLLCGDKKTPTLSDDGLVTWLDPSWDGTSVVDPLLATQADAEREAFRAEADKRAAHLKGTAFAGSETCKSCHPSAFEVWRKSRHAHAYGTLKGKNQHETAECVGCHVLGQDVKGGFVDEKRSPQFANVQCESCHGPRREHARNPAVKAASRKGGDACLACHNPTHSPRFTFPAYWEKIKHR